MPQKVKHKVWGRNLKGWFLAPDYNFHQNFAPPPPEMYVLMSYSPTLHICFGSENRII